MKIKNEDFINFIDDNLNKFLCQKDIADSLNISLSTLICKCGREFKTPESYGGHTAQCLIHRDGKKPIDKWGILEIGVKVLLKKQVNLLKKWQKH